MTENNIIIYVISAPLILAQTTSILYKLHWFELGFFILKLWYHRKNIQTFFRNVELFPQLVRWGMAWNWFFSLYIVRCSLIDFVGCATIYDRWTELKIPDDETADEGPYLSRNMWLMELKNSEWGDKKRQLIITLI